MTDAVDATDDSGLDYISSKIAPHFDAAYYAAEYPDLTLDAGQLLRHYCAFGWQEGRNPSAYFDTVAYLQASRDVQRARMNPLLHYVVQGRYEQRVVVPAASPSVRSALLFGQAVPDWVAALRGEVDTPYYRSQLPADFPDEVDLVAHFAFFGWREGLSPTPRQPMADLMHAYREAVNTLVNPLLAHLEALAGRFETTSSTPVPAAPETALPEAASPEQSSEPGATAVPTLDEQLEVVRGEFDGAFYLAAEKDVAAAGMDPLHHYVFTGWREGRNPTPHFDSAYYLASNPDVVAANVNPFWHYIAQGRAEGRTARDAAGSRPAAAQLDDTDQIELVRNEFSADYYLAENTDVAKAGLDPLLHYFRTGWREGRNPNKDFDTRYYLDANQDVRDSGIQPFWHYLVAGRQEGRSPCRPGGFRRRVIEAVQPPAQRVADWPAAQGKRIGAQVLERRLRAAIATRAGVCVALSHDCYIRVIGGTQIFIADEQHAFATRDHAYVHLSPRQPRLDLAPEDPAAEVQIVVDGSFLGIAAIRVLVDALRRLRGTLAQPAQLVIHSLLGFNEADVVALKDALAPRNAIFWLHDYTSICEGFNLLRNDLDHCHAPPVTSQVCRVCIYGKTRQRHQERLRWLFHRCDFQVMSPSAVTLDLWNRAAALPARSAEVHAHWQLKPGRRIKAAAGPVRIAFVGFPSTAKGWPVFASLMERFGGDDRYRFLHFGAKGITTLPGCTFVVTEVTPTDRQAATKRLREHEIDFLAMLSPWPETFSFVAHEGVAAGCQLLCLDDSGNVAALARDTGGFVFQGARELEAFLESDAASAVAAKARASRRGFLTINSGTTATVSRLFEDAAAQ